MSNWLERTGQRWKFSLFVWGTILGVAIFGFLFVALALGASFNLGLLAAAMFLIAGSLVWLCMSIRCRLCSGYPAWWLIRHVRESDWYPMLVSSPTCPLCHDGDR